MTPHFSIYIGVIFSFQLILFSVVHFQMVRLRPIWGGGVIGDKTHGLKLPPSEPAAQENLTVVLYGTLLRRFHSYMFCFVSWYISVEAHLRTAENTHSRKKYDMGTYLSMFCVVMTKQRLLLLCLSIRSNRRLTTRYL